MLATADPTFTIEHIVDEPLRVFRVGDRRSRRARVAELLDQPVIDDGPDRRADDRQQLGQFRQVDVVAVLLLEAAPVEVFG